jgi:hypothetical protein
MIIEIHKPELEALIVERMSTVGFRNVEDALMHAFETSYLPGPKPPNEENRSGAALIAAMQSSPHREIDIEPARYKMPVRDAEF